MRVKDLKWVYLTLPLIASLFMVNVSCDASTVVFTDPPMIMNESLQSGSHFTVDVNISDVSDLYSWQVNMSWDPSMLDMGSPVEGDFLRGNRRSHGTINRTPMK